MFYLDVYDASDNLLGPGPYFRVSEVSHDERLDEVPEWVFTIPVLDPRIDDTLEDSSASYAEVICNHPVAGRMALGYCLLDDGERRLVDTGGGPRWQYRLPSLMAELGWACTFPAHRYDDVDGNNILSDDAIAGSLYGLFHSNYGLSGWDAGTVDALGNMTLEFSGETILEAVRKLCSEAGLHFRENATTRRRLDVGAFGASSGVRIHKAGMATRGMRDQDTIVYIQGLELTEERQIHNWILPLGGGADPANMLTLENSTRSSPYTIQSTTGPDGETRYYIEDTMSQSSYGERRHQLILRDVLPASSVAADLQAAANQLYDAAVEYLQDHMAPHYVYRVDVIDAGGVDGGALRPGNTVHLVYRGVATHLGVDYRWVDVDDDDLMIVSRSRQWDAQGRAQYSLDLSDQERMAATDASLVQTMARRLRALSHHPQAAWDGSIDGGRISGSVGDADTVDGYDTLSIAAAADTYLGMLILKTTTGDPNALTTPQGALCVNTVDNTFRVLEGGAWRAVASW